MRPVPRPTAKNPASGAACGCLAIILLVVGAIGWMGAIGASDAVATATADADYVIRVGGDPGRQFSGSYYVYSSERNGGASLEGVTPAEYRMRGTALSVRFQKDDPGRSRLTIEIVKAGKSVGSTATTASYGVVSLTN